MKSNIIRNVVVLLLVVIVAEVVYIGYLAKTSKQDNKSAQAQLQNIEIKRTTNNPAINWEVLQTLSKMSKTSESKINFITEINSTVLDIDSKGAELAGRFFPFRVKVKSSDTLDNGYWLHIPKHVYDKAQILIKSQDQTVTGQWSDLQINDKVTTVEVWDPYYGPSNEKQVISYTIYINR